MLAYCIGGFVGKRARTLQHAFARLGNALVHTQPPSLSCAARTTPSSFILRKQFELEAHEQKARNKWRRAVFCMKMHEVRIL